MVSGSPPYISLEKEGQVYYSNNILLILETIFKIDNKKTDAWIAGQAFLHIQKPTDPQKEANWFPTLRWSVLYYNENLHTFTSCHRCQYAPPPIQLVEQVKNKGTTNFQFLILDFSE